MANLKHLEWFGPRGGPFEAEFGRHVVCWDKDSTLAHNAHRHHMVDAIRAGDKSITWDDYSAACAGDGVLTGAATALRLMQGGGTRHFIITGANASAHMYAAGWARRHFIPYDAMAMRAGGNHEPNPRLKIQAVHEIRKMMMIVDLFVEDWPQCARQIHEETGVPTLTVNPNYEMDPRDGLAHVR